MSARVTFEHGIVVRKDAMGSRKIDRPDLLAIFEVTEPLSEDQDLIVFGPSFGQEACNEFIRRLQAAGLRYVDDFFALELDHPEWLTFSAALSR
jgi:surfactin synthase thioesterase subunit